MNNYKNTSMLRVWYIEVPNDYSVSGRDHSNGFHRNWVITREEVTLPLSPWEEYYFPDTEKGLVDAKAKRDELQRRDLWATK